MTFDEVQKEILSEQEIFNEKIKDILASCDDNVCIRIMPTYLSTVDKKEGYPIQLNVWNKNLIEQPAFPIFGKGVRPL